jgi:hypothetical protein
MSRAVGQCVSIGDRLIAIGVLLCLGILIVVSGPDLVYHLVDRHPRYPHPQTHTSQSPDCLILSLMQHILLRQTHTSQPPDCLILSLMQHILLRVSSRVSIYRVAAPALSSAGLNPVTVTTYLGIVGVTLFLLLISIRRLDAALQRIVVSNQRQVSQPDRR